MIYKISFKDDNRPDYRVLMDTMARVGDYCYSAKDFFLDTDKTFEEMRSLFNGGLIEEIGPSYNLSTCSELVRDWCNEKFAMKALREFEQSDEGQSRMREILAYLDAIEEKRRKEGVKVNGKAGSKRDTKHKADKQPETKQCVEPASKRSTS